LDSGNGSFARASRIDESLARATSSLRSLRGCGLDLICTHADATAPWQQLHQHRRGLHTVKEALLRLLTLLVTCTLFGCTVRPHQTYHLTPVNPTCPSPHAAIDTLTFHGDRARTGWNPMETELTPSVVRGPAFGWLWDSPPFDSATVNGTSYPPRVYASPLYVDDLQLTGGAYAGTTVSAAFVATSNGWIYAVNVCDPGSGVAAGTIVWSTQLTAPAPADLHDATLLGVLSTPFIDLDALPPRLYVASMDGSTGWQLFALELTSGTVVPGWPVAINDAVLSPLNSNGPSLFHQARSMSQRGALNLSPARDLLYVPFGAYHDISAGWMAAIDTNTARAVAAFSSAPTSADKAHGGMWGPGGPAIDSDGRIYETTGNAPGDTHDTPRVWGNSLLSFAPPLTLASTYSPFNYCQLDTSDIDLGGSSPLLVPELDPGESSTRRLMAFGGKQGNVYLLERDQLRGGTAARPPCSTDSSSDGSLLAPDLQPQFGARGPLNVFGPYETTFGDQDHSKMRTTPAYFRDATGARFLFVSGSTKAAPGSTTSVAPSVVKLRIVTAPGAPAYLAIEKTDPSLALFNPGSPVVSSNGAAAPVVWVLDPNSSRSANLIDPNTPNPVLYAVDGTTLAPLWQSPPDLLQQSGKYSTPVIAHGWVLVGTDRLQAFGVRP